MGNIDDKVVEKIKKLLALTDSANEHEAKIAMLMAQKLMARHNLDIKDVVAKDKENVCEIYAGTYGKRTWRRILAKVISKNFRCEHFYNNRGNKGFIVVFVGLLDDIKIAKSIYEFAISVIEKNQKRVYKELRMVGFETKGVKKSYAIGFVYGLDDSFEEQKDEMPEEYALVLQIPEVVIDFMENKEFDGSTPEVNLEIENRLAMGQGYEDGIEFGRNNADPTEESKECKADIA